MTVLDETVRNATSSVSTMKKSLWQRPKWNEGRPLARMLKHVFVMLGLAWADLAANGAKVRGAIVARQIDSNLGDARGAHDTEVYLIGFEMKIGATAV